MPRRYVRLPWAKQMRLFDVQTTYQQMVERGLSPRTESRCVSILGPARLTVAAAKAILLQCAH